MYVSHDAEVAARAKRDSAQRLTMSTASMESLCAMAHTPTAKTLKLDQLKEMGSSAMDPLQQQQRDTEVTPGQGVLTA